jgi:hypothetical protein
MKKSLRLGTALTALSMTWFVSGGPVSAQMPIMIGDTLMPGSASNENEFLGAEVAVDGSGKWLKLRTARHDHARRIPGMADLLEFDAAETLTTFEAGAELSADDYRFPAEASPRRRIWVYDGDPLDRGVYKQELGTSNGSANSNNSTLTQFRAPLVRTSQPTRSGRLEERVGKARVVEIIIRTPGIVVNAVRSVYQNGNATFLGIGLIGLVIAFATLRDLVSGTRRA